MTRLLSRQSSISLSWTKSFSSGLSFFMQSKSVEHMLKILSVVFPLLVEWRFIKNKRASHEGSQERQRDCQEMPVNIGNKKPFKTKSLLKSCRRKQRTYDRRWVRDTGFADRINFLSLKHPFLHHHLTPLTWQKSVWMLDALKAPGISLLSVC